MKSMMFDLETMSTSPRAAIVQIGACIFDHQSGDIDQRFSVNVSLHSSMRAGLEVDEGSVEFWMKQPLKTWMTGDKHHLHTALMAFKDFAKKRGDGLVWCHASFDAPIIKSAFDAVNSEQPFNYRKVMDLRTLYAIAAYEPPEIDGAMKHDALSDCEYQVRCCVEAMRKLL